MSESVSAPSSAPATSAPQGTNAPAVQEQGATQAQAKAEASKEAGAKAAPKTAEEELEEIKLGSASGRVPKGLAKTIKDLERGFHAKAQEIAGIKNHFTSLAKQAQENPLIADAIMEQLGIDADAYSQARLAKKLELEMMDPNARKALELERKLAEYEAKEKEALEKAEKEKLTAAEKEEDLRLRQDLVKSWEKSGLPPDPRFGAWIAATMVQAQEQGLDWTMDQAAAKVKDDWMAHVRAVVEQMDPEGIQNLLGDKPLKKWREYDVGRVTKKAPGSESAAKEKRPEASASASKPKEKKALSEAEYREYFSKLARG